MGLSEEAKGRLDALLHGRQEEIVKQWTAISARSLRGRMTEVELSRRVTELYGALLGLLGGAGTADLDGPEGTELRAVLTDLSSGAARNGFTPRETASIVFAVKEALLDVQQRGGETVVPPDFIALSRLVDEMGLFTFETFAHARENLIIEQNEQLLELSTPAVKLWDGVVAVPLIGTLDSARAQVVMEKLLQTLVDTSSGYAIIDITGVPAVDTQVAQHILKTVVAARLMGAECIISGIRPQIAQTVVALGIEFGDIVTKASLADALAYALKGRGIELTRRSARREP